MRFYRGHRDADGVAHVTIDDDGQAPRALPLRLDLDNHSPTGFEWGYGGSGPAQLALALLADALCDDAQAIVLHQRFKWKFIAPLPQAGPWQMTASEVHEKAMIAAQEVPNFHERVELARP